MSWHLLAKEIVTNCKPYLKLISNNTSKFQLWRGMKLEVGEYFCQTHHNRKPRNTPLEVHHWIDKWFLQNYNHKFRSSNIVFCAGKTDGVKEYGPRCLIFPAGKIKYTWSPHVNDLLVYFVKTWLNESDPLTVSKSILKVRTTQMLKHFSDNEFYIMSNLTKAIQSKNEIMMNCLSYYAIPEEVSKDLLKCLDEIL